MAHPAGKSPLATSSGALRSVLFRIVSVLKSRPLGGHFYEKGQGPGDSTSLPVGKKNRPPGPYFLLWIDLFPPCKVPLAGTLSSAGGAVQDMVPHYIFIPPWGVEEYLNTR